MKLTPLDYLLAPFTLALLVTAYVVIGAVCWVWALVSDDN